ncbi:hypothetical protein BDN71DRAFT_1512276 [Pleurotus eryngii]|uniref:C2H2-type domain-containing protein n=1 Tax=Pleurotus eryngii TaxID=5323 RepID=A0A9P6DB66_PLEER|nr:hypothetical protein BDN71DRAFT_1512276 [Pleurotus eryngii]
MKRIFHPYDQDGRPARGNRDVANGNRGQASPKVSGASQARGSMAGWYEQALPPVGTSSASSANPNLRHQRVKPRNTYPVVTSTTNVDVALDSSQPQPGAATTNSARIFPIGGSNGLGQDPQPLPQRAPRLQFSRYRQSQPQPQPQAFSGPANPGNVLRQQQWGGDYRNFYLPQQAFVNGGWYSQEALALQNAHDHQIAHPLQSSQATSSHTAPSTGQIHPQYSVNGSYFAVYPPAPTTNGASQEFFARDQIPPQGLAVPSARASGGVLGAVPVSSYDGGCRRAPHESSKAQVAKGIGAPKKIRTSLQDQNRGPFPRALPDDEAECPRPNCGKVMKKTNIPRHLKSKSHGGEGAVCPLCTRRLARADCVARHVKKYCPNRIASSDVIEEDDDDDDEGDTLPSGSTSGTRSHVPARPPFNARSLSRHNDTPSPHATSECSLNGLQAEGGYADNTHPAIPATYIPTPLLDAAPCDLYADDVPDPVSDVFDNVLEYCEEPFDPQGSRECIAEDMVESLNSTVGNVSLVTELSSDNTADPAAEDQTTDVPNDVAGPAPDADDLEDALLHELDDHDYGGERNDPYDFDRGYGLEDLLGDTHSVGEEKGEGGNDDFSYYY